MFISKDSSHCWLGHASFLKTRSAAYETLSDEKRRREYDQLGDNAFSSEDMNGGQRFHHSFDFNFNDMFRDSDIYSQNRHARQKRHFDEHLKAHQQAHNRHKRHFQGAFGTGTFEDMFEDMEKMFTFDRHIKRTESRFQGTTKQHCRTVTQRRGNMVTTYTDCTSSWTSARTITLVFLCLI